MGASCGSSASTRRTRTLAKAALEKLVDGKRLELRFAGNRADRNGRVLAELFANGRWVERELVRRGLARVHGAADNRMGLAALLAVEDQARQKRHGLWRAKRFAVRDAGDAARDAGTWQIVEGTVVDVAHVEGGTFIHFGADWRELLSAHLGRDAEKLARAAGLDAKSAGGRAGAGARLHRRHTPPDHRSDLSRTDRAALKKRPQRELAKD